MFLKNILGSFSSLAKLYRIQNLSLVPGNCLILSTSIKMNSINISVVIILQLLLLYQNCGAENILSELEDELFVKHNNHTFRVTVYTEANFWGIPWSATVANCTDVPRLFYKKASSINTHDNCMILYSRQRCKGRHVQVSPGSDGHSRLSEIDFDNTMASIKPCNSTHSSSREDSSENTIDDKRSKRSPSIIDKILGLSSTSTEDEANNGNDENTADDGQDSRGSSEPEPQSEDGAVDIPTFFQNFNLKNLVNKLTNNDDESEDGGSDLTMSPNSGRFRRASENHSTSNIENRKIEQEHYDAISPETSTARPSVPLQNVIY